MKISRLIGNLAEDRAVEYLKKNGFFIVERNFFSRFGEIDIVAKRKDILHFMEVKYSKSFDPLERITKQKLQKIIKTVDYYMLKNNFDENFQIDALIVTESDIELLENISY